MLCQLKRRRQKIKFFLRIIVSLIITSLALFNWKYLKYQRGFKKINKHKSKFDKILESRNLHEIIKKNIYDESFDKICEKSHKKLREYYLTGNLDKIDGIDDKIFTYDNKAKDKIHIKSLLNIIKFLTNNENEKNKNLIDIDSTKNEINTYFKHNAPAIFFLVIASLTIPAWAILIICSLPRFNFCCYNFFNNIEFKTTFCISIGILYLLSFSISLYGLIKSNLIFTDIADIECSIHKFFEQSLEGEGKETYPKWIGLNKINKTLNEFNIKIQQLDKKTLNDLYQKIDNINNKKINFKNKMEESGNAFYSSPESNIYTNLYSNEYDIDARGISGRYVLDIVKMFGRKVTGINEEKYEPKNSTLDLWHNEYKYISKNADDYFEETIKDLQIISNKSEIFEKIVENISILKEFFITIYENIEYSLIDNSKFIYKYGKVLLVLFFSFLFIVNLVIIISIFFIFLFSVRSFINNYFLYFTFKWVIINILYLLMIISFLLGNFFIFMGSLGNDIIIALSVVLDKDNFGEKEYGIFDHLGEAKDYLNVYINGNGSIDNLLNINDNQINLFKDIEALEDKINEKIYEFEDIKKFKTYYYFQEKLESRLNLSTIPILIKDTYQINIPIDDEQLYGSQTDRYLKFDYELELMNTIIRAQNLESNTIEQWKLNSDSPNECDSGVDPIFNYSEFNPLKCRPLDRDWIQATSSTALKKEATIVSDILEFLDNANNALVHKSLINILNDLKNEYNEYIDLYIKTLVEFKEILYEFSNLLRQYNNNRDDYIFSFINGKTIGTNLKILAKYIKSILGTDVKTMGICLIIIGFSLALSIPLTVLLLIIIHESYKAQNSANNPTIISKISDNKQKNISKNIPAIHRKRRSSLDRHINFSTSSSLTGTPRTHNPFEEAKQFLIKGCKIDKEILDDTYNRRSGWRTNDSGPKEYLKKYHPPKGAIGIGLKVALLYPKENINKYWLGDDNNEGEWYIAYHGVKSIEAIHNICKEGFRRGDGQNYRNSDNKNPLSNKKYHKCGEGVYFTNEIDEAKKYAKPIDYNKNQYQIIFMCRVNPYEVRIADIGNNQEYWIVKGDKLGDLYGKKRSDQVRPYRIIVSKVEKNNKK